MDNSSIVPFLFFITFLLALIFGVVQFFKAKKARREHHHSAAEKQDRATDGAKP